MLECSFAYRCRSEDERAVGYGVGDIGGGSGGGEDAGGVDRGLGGLKRYRVFIDDAEVGVTEVMHRTGYGADVGRVACTYENDGDPVLFFSLHASILCGLMRGQKSGREESSTAAE